MIIFLNKKLFLLAFIGKSFFLQNKAFRKLLDSEFLDVIFFYSDKKNQQS
jgi:hypothetical protein